MTIIGNTLLSRDQIVSKAKAESDDYIALIDAYGNPACVLVSDMLDDLPLNSSLYFDPVGGDADIDILTVGVTGTPKLSWDESEDVFVMTKGLWVNGGTTKLYKETTGVAEAAFVAGSGTAVNDNSTFGGYTLQQIVQALQNQGLLT